MVHAVLWQRLEGLIAFVAGLVLVWHWGAEMPWWTAVLVFFIPDLSFLAYAGGPRVGAAVYNAVHIYGLGAGLLAIGLVMSSPLLLSLGALWFAHSGLDRMLGYGLKSTESFSITHLGPIGRRRGE